MALFNLKQRQRARKLCLQALYQWQVTQADPGDVVLQFEQSQPMDNIDRAYFDEVYHGVVKHRVALDQALVAAMTRTVEELDPVELTVLRMGAYELQYLLDVPYKVVIHEACALEMQFGSSHGYQYINAVLDRLAKQWRANEYQDQAPPA